MSEVTLIADGKPDGTSFESVHVGVLREFSGLVAELGGSAAALFAEVGLEPENAMRHRGVLGYRHVANLLERAAVTLACPDLGLRLAARQGAGAFAGRLGAGMRNADNLGEALRFVSEHSYAHSPAAGIWLLRSPSGRTVTVGHDILLDRLPNRAQLMEQFLMLGHLAALELTGGQVRARRILFRHQPISSPQVYRAHFGCDVRFGQHADAVVYFERDLEAKVVDRDAQAFQAASAFLAARYAGRRPPLHAQVRGIVTHFVRANCCSAARVAEELGLHVRTLHRRLAAEGTSFQRIKDEVRRDLMVFYLGHTDFSLGRVSEGLGFAEQSVMSRFCRKWLAASPSEVREKSGLGRGSYSR